MEMKDKSHIIALIVILTVLAVIVTLFMIGMLLGNIGFVRFRNMHRVRVSNELVLNKEYDINFKKIEIKSEASNIYLKESSDNKVKVIIYGDEEKTSVDTSNDQLSIESKSKNCFLFCINIKASKIEVYVPKDYKNTIDIDNKYGDVEIGSFKDSDIKIKASCGDVSISKANRINVINDYGDVKIKEANEVDIKASCGDIEIGSVNDARIKNNYGDININSINNYMNIKEDCGDIEIENVNIKKKSYIKNSLGKVEISHTNDIHIDAKTDLGETSVNDNYKSDITLTIKNSCGDIEVNN